jgi:hypothetical protein
MKWIVQRYPLKPPAAILPGEDFAFDSEPRYFGKGRRIKAKGEGRT